MINNRPTAPDGWLWVGGRGLMPHSGLFYKIFGCILLSKIWTKAFTLRGFCSFSWNIGHEECIYEINWNFLLTGSVMVGCIFPFLTAQPPMSFTLRPLFHIYTDSFLARACTGELLTKRWMRFNDRRGKMRSSFVWCLSLSRYQVRRTGTVLWSTHNGETGLICSLPLIVSPFNLLTKISW